MVSLRELKVSALSSEEWSYLRGLHLADGYTLPERARRAQNARYEVYFFFDGRDGKEGELVRRVVGLLSRAGLTPKIRRARHANMLVVAVYSKMLADFLPDKRSLLNDGAAVRRFFEENELFRVEYGVPFVAGLMDGDGCCQIIVDKRSNICFTWLGAARWRFTQRKYLFLVDYIEKFVGSLAPNSVSIEARGDGLVEARIRKSGKSALLDAGIANYSWKVARFLWWMNETRAKRSGFYFGKQVARMLKVDYKTLLKWLEAGRMRYLRKTVVPRKARKMRSSVSRFYIPVEEAERLKAMLSEDGENIQRIKSGGVKITDAARLLDVTTGTVYRWYQLGKLRGTIVHEGMHRYLVFPREEV